jgi:hypothetical protein
MLFWCSKCVQKSTGLGEDILGSGRGQWPAEGALWGELRSTFGVTADELHQGGGIDGGAGKFFGAGVDGGERVRRSLLDAITPLWPAYGLDEHDLPPEAVLFLLSCIPRMLHLEGTLGTVTGHAETIGLVERFLDKVEPRS